MAKKPPRRKAVAQPELDAPLAPVVWFERHSAILVGLAFALYLVVGCVIAGDYGISWDEPAMRDFGRYAVQYISALDRTREFLPPEAPAKFHPVTFEVIYNAAGIIFGPADSGSEYRLRHLVTFLAFFSFAGAFFAMARRYLSSSLLAAAATLALVCQPRIFADSFYNPKDIPFLITYGLGAFTMLVCLERAGIGIALLHALVCALAIATRIGGVFLVVVTLIAQAAMVASVPREARSRHVRTLVVFAAVVGPLTVLCWPVLWRDPINEFPIGIAFLSRYPFAEPVLFNGRMIPASDLPWYYIPEWMAITTPLVVLAIIVVGAGYLLRQLARRHRARQTSVVDAGMLMLILLPMATVVATHPTLYDGWRHMFFVFPILVLVGFKGAKELIEGMASEKTRRRASATLGSALAINLTLTIVFMIANHPHQNVYFNAAAGADLSEVRRRFELDYWGLSYRQALEHLLREDRDAVINVAVGSAPGVFNADMLPEADRRRLRFVQEPEPADYFIGNYRWHPDEYVFGTPFFTINVDGGPVVTIRKLKP